jgi:hypothetical protein
MACLTTAVSAATAQVRVETTDYKGWAGCARISNRDIEIVFVPQIGRVMRYARKGGPNLLWENPALLGKTRASVPISEPWANFGGDKLWNAPQSRWNWPPDAEIDAGPHKVTHLSDGIRTEGTPSRRVGLRMIREIRMRPHGTEVLFSNRMENVGAETSLWSIWQVTQVADPVFAAMQAHTTDEISNGYRTVTEPAPGMLTKDGDRILLRRDRTKPCKIGTDHPGGVLWAQIGSDLLEMHYEVPKTGSPADGHSWMEIYTNPDPLAYIELEAVGPLMAIAPGQAITHRTRWKIRSAS